MLVPRLYQNSSIVNTEYARKSKQLYSLFDKALGALMYIYVIIIIIIVWFGLVSPRSYIATFIPTFHKQGNRLDKRKLHANN